MEIDTLEAIQAGGTTQWIRVRGAAASNPVLLLIQQGPGLPMINEARRFGHLLGLEQAFTVVYWDQRGCGRSLRGHQDRAGISVERMAADTVATLVAVGMDIDGAGAGTGAYDFALAAARQRGHRRATRQLRAIGPPPHLTSKQFATRVRWATNFGGVTTGETYGSLARGLPVVMVQGRHDQVAPGGAAQRYASSLQAPGKRLVWYEN